MAAFAQGPITKDNWLSHPSITEIRSIYQQVNALVSSKQLKKDSNKCELHDGNVVMTAELYRNKQDVVRKLVIDGGSGDSSVRAEYYYDKQGTPRFTFRKQGAVNGTWKEFRIYYGVDGQHLFSQNLQGGPGYTDSGFADAEPDPELAYGKACKE